DLAAREDWKDLIQKYAHLIIVFLMAYFVVVFLFLFMIQAAVAVAFSRFRARWFNYMAGHTRFAAVQLSASVSSWSMFRLLFGNMLLQILTLGLARPFVAHRMLRFACTHLRVSGLESLGALRQSSVRPRPPASGLAQLLDTGGFT